MTDPDTGAQFKSPLLTDADRKAASSTETSLGSLVYVGAEHQFDGGYSVAGWFSYEMNTMDTEILKTAADEKGEKEGGGMNFALGGKKELGEHKKIKSFLFTGVRYRAILDNKDEMGAVKTATDTDEMTTYAITSNLTYVLGVSLAIF